MMKLRTRRVMAVAGAAIAASLMLTGCSALTNLLGGGDAPRSETGEVIEGSDIDIFSLKVGDCKMEDPDGELQSTSVVPCSEPHDEEVFFEFALEGDQIPERIDIDNEAQEKCIPAFEEYVGIDFDSSSLTLFWIVPTEETWNQRNDRIVQCVLYSMDASLLTGSMKGAAI